MFYFANDLYLILVKPLSVLLPDSGNMIATGVASPFLVPFKLTLVLAVLLAVPFLLHQVWVLSLPACTSTKEIRYSVTGLQRCPVLTGIAFAYFVVLPLAFGFFTAAGPEGISFMPDISNILDLFLKSFCLWHRF